MTEVQAPKPDLSTTLAIERGDQSETNFKLGHYPKEQEIEFE